MCKGSRWNVVISGLLYPAFLGNLIYLAFEKNIARDPATVLSFTGLLVILLLLHYVLDYVYTVEERPDYGALAFVFDLMIVFFLYLGVKAAIASHDPSSTPSQAVAPGTLLIPALWFGFSKLSAFGWELHRAYVESNAFSNRLKKISVFAMVSDGSIALLAFVAYWLRDCRWTSWLLLLVVLVDVVLYRCHVNKHRKWKDALV